MILVERPNFDGLRAPYGVLFALYKGSYIVLNLMGVADEISYFLYVEY